MSEPLTRDEALAALKALAVSTDEESAHVEADGILLLLINDPEITAAFWAIDKWYS